MTTDSTASHAPLSEDEAQCEALRLKIAKGLPAELMAEFQVWVSLEQDLSYARGRADEAQARETVDHFKSS